MLGRVFCPSFSGRENLEIEQNTNVFPKRRTHMKKATTTCIPAMAMSIALAAMPLVPAAALAVTPSDATDIPVQTTGAGNAETAENDLSNATITLDKDKYVYDGKLAIKPQVTAKLEDKVLKEFEDYTLSFSDNKAAGTGKVTLSNVAGAGLAGSKTVEFQIVAGEPATLQFDKPALEKFDYGMLPNQVSTMLASQLLKDNGTLANIDTVERIYHSMPAGKYRIILDEGHHASLKFSLYGADGKTIESEKEYFLGDTFSDRNVKDTDGSYIVQEIELPAAWTCSFVIDDTDAQNQISSDKALHFELIEPAEPGKASGQAEPEPESSGQTAAADTPESTPISENKLPVPDQSAVVQQTISKTADYVIPTVLTTIAVAAGALLLLRYFHLK